MLQEAIITKIRDDGLAEVVVERLGICGGDCNGCNECKYEHLMKSVVQNPIGARRGQHVMIETPTNGVVKGALAIYVLPLVMLILGYLIADALSLGESACIIAAFAAAVLGIVIAVILSRARHSADPTPTKIVSVIQD
jgi:sigma-E factor negative regulatory protein RseC